MFNKHRAVLAGSLIPSAILIWAGCNLGTGLPGFGRAADPAAATQPAAASAFGNSTWTLTFTRLPLFPGEGTATATLVLNAQYQFVSFTVLSGPFPQPDLAKGDTVQVLTGRINDQRTMSLFINYASNSGLYKSVMARGFLTGEFFNLKWTSMVICRALDGKQKWGIVDGVRQWSP